MTDAPRDALMDRLPATDRSLLPGGARSRTRRSRVAEGPLVTLVLKSCGDGGVFARRSFVAGDDDDEAEARVWIENQRDAWWYRAPHYCGDGLVIEAA